MLYLFPPCCCSPVPFDLLCEDYEAVDHRLKLFLDVEVFQAEEELHSFLKVRQRKVNFLKVKFFRVTSIKVTALKVTSLKV